ncbi:MAG: hypothetical protein ACT4PI_11220 [Actinomycetota bacterium]
MAERDAATSRREIRRNERCPRCGENGATVRARVFEDESGHVHGTGTIELAWCRNGCHRRTHR